jgi:hypothetical protein
MGMCGDVFEELVIWLLEKRQRIVKNELLGEASRFRKLFSFQL